ncbi:MAG: aldo/keto reductase [Gemella sp.]|nr:aldo/keto reductase [Gemella sp.]
MNIGKMGFGTYKITDEKQGIENIRFALNNGYNLIDTAAYYNNEEVIGKAIDGLDKSKFSITTKVWPSNLAYDDALRSFEESHKKLNEKIDILLIHWPHPDKFLDGYRALEKIKEDGLVKEIGVANFEIRHLEALKNKANIKPFLNQIEAHPKLAQNELKAYLDKEGIILQTWSPIARGLYTDHPLIIELAKKYQVTPNQIVLNWHVKKGYHPIPKSSNNDRILENIKSLDFELSLEDFRKINSLDEGHRTGMHPDLFPYE